MQVAVVGGGASGLSTAFFLAQAGHEVVVIERQTNVAEGASFGSAGTMSPVHAMPWASPGMPRKLLPMLFRQESPVFIERRLDPLLWRWARQWMSECNIDRYRLNGDRAFRIASYSQEVMRELRQQVPFEYERTEGYLQVYRTARELELAAPLHDLLVEREVPCRIIDPEEARAIEPALSRSATIAGALHLPQDDAGNCPLFCKQLRNAAMAIGVNFHFGEQVTSIEPAAGNAGHVHLRLGEDRFPVDAVVVAAGASSMALLEPLGIRLPFYPVRTYAATAAIRNFDDAPLATVNDSVYRVAITRMGTRIRLAGTAVLGSVSGKTPDRAIGTLLKVGQDWFPDAAYLNSATLWSGITPTLPDGPPVLGHTPVRNVFLNIGHGANSWTMAAGAGRVVADIVSGNPTDIDTDGLTLSRFG